MTSRLRVLAAITLLALFLTGCATASIVPAEPAYAGTYPVDPLFQEFYKIVGGTDTIGPAVSRLISEKGLPCQYTLNALMCFNPEAPIDQRFFLAKLGTAIADSNQLALPAPAETQKHEVFPEFETFYKEQITSRFAGQPLTPVFFNPQKNRFEQYFESVGMAYQPDVPFQKVHLIALGLNDCGDRCQARLPNASDSFSATDRLVNVLAISSLNRLGGFSVFGFPLTGPITGPDGKQEQVFKPVVFYIDYDATKNPFLRLRALANILNLPKTAPYPKPNLYDKSLTFTLVAGDKGYLVPIVFNEFIIDHGGQEVSGAPVSEAMYIDRDGQPVINPDNPNDYLVRQCFENYCLDYNVHAPEKERVSLAPLGILYLDRIQKTAQPFVISSRTVHLEVTEKLAEVKDTEPETLDIYVLSIDGNAPIANIDLVVVVGLPNGSTITLEPPPTDQKGHSSITIPAMPGSPSGLVPYDVCLDIKTDQPICKEDTYLIWNSK